VEDLAEASNQTWIEIMIDGPEILLLRLLLAGGPPKSKHWKFSDDCKATYVSVVDWLQVEK
jgi:hypothetical protein